MTCSHGIDPEDEFCVFCNRVAEDIATAYRNGYAAAIEDAARLFKFDSHTSGDGHVEEMCPNCVTPWKCNGPAVDEDVCAWASTAIRALLDKVKP